MEKIFTEFDDTCAHCDKKIIITSEFAICGCCYKEFTPNCNNANCCGTHDEVPLCKECLDKTGEKLSGLFKVKEKEIE